MSDNSKYNDRSAKREKPSSGWHSASERRNDRGGQRRWNSDRSRGERRWSEDRRDDRGFNRKDRGSNRRWDNERPGGDRGWRDDRGGERRWSEDRRGERDLNRRDRGTNRRRDNVRPRGERGGEHRGRFEAEGNDLRHLDIPESITAEALDEGARRRLMSLNKENSNRVARHLAYAGEMMDIDPEVAYQHASAAYQRAARIDIVREALGLTAYVTGRYSEALRELRTYRRMSDDFSHVPLEADSERGLGRPEKALRFIEGIPLNRLNPEAKVELAIVTSGARAETGDSEGGLSVLEKILVENLEPELGARVQLTKADRLEELNRKAEADEIRATWQPIFEDDAAEDMVLDLDDVLDDLPAEDESADSHEGFSDEGFGDDDFDEDELDEEFSDNRDNFDDEEEKSESDESNDFDDEEFVEAFDELFDTENDIEYEDRKEAK